MQAAILNEDGVVENIIELPDDHDPDDEASYSPPEGFELRVFTGTNVLIGGRFVDGQWEEPSPPNGVPPSPPDRVDILTELLRSKEVLTDEEVAQLREQV